MKKLNLGSGAFLKEGYVNLDVTPKWGADVIHDLREFPYPFPDDEFDLVEADHCLEHVPEPFPVMRELHRITRPGGAIHIRVPHFSRGFSHAEHMSGFDITFPYYFRPEFVAGYQDVELKLDKQRLRWFAQPYLKRTVLPKPLFYAATGVGAALDVVANLSPSLCSRLWCFWVGGFEELEFRFSVVK
jgi:SAM-dependent methyltransferase